MAMFLDHLRANGPTQFRTIRDKAKFLEHWAGKACSLTRPPTLARQPTTTDDLAMPCLTGGTSHGFAQSG